MTDEFDEDEDLPEDDPPTGFRVTSIHLDGPDGKSTSRPMSVEQAIEWLEKKTGYKTARICVEADVEKIRQAIIEGLGAGLDRKAAEIRKELNGLAQGAVTQAEAQAKQRWSLLESDMKQLKEELPWMLALARDIRHDRDDKAAAIEAVKRQEKLVAGLRVEMAVPGRHCSNWPCKNLFSVHGIAMNVQYRGLVCGVCGKGGEGEKIIVLPDEPVQAPRLEQKAPSKKKRKKR